MIGKDLDRDCALQPRVLRLPHLPHPSRTERALHLVGAQARSGSDRHGSPDCFSEIVSTAPPAAAHNARMILFRSRAVLAIYTPPRVSMATSSRQGKSAEEAVARLLAACGEPADQELLLVHRLDVGTSGVVLLAKSAAAHRALSNAFQSGGARKTYRA